MTVRELIVVIVLALAVYNVAALFYFWRQDRGRPTPRRNVIDLDERRRARQRGLEQIMAASRERPPW